MSNNLVSIGIPTYNSADRLGPLLENFLKQTYTNLEIIVSDDASKDNTYAVCQSYAAGDSRVRCIRQEKNLGQLGNFPFVLKEAKGEYFMWASDDDHWSYQFVEKLVAVLDQHPDYGLAMSSHTRLFEKRLPKAVRMTGRFDLTHQSHFSNFRKMALGEGIHCIFYGIFRRKFLADLMRRQRPECICWDRVVMAEVTLATRVYTLPEILFFKHQNPVPVRKRYKDKLSNAYMRQFPHSRYLLSLLFRQLSSPLIPRYRKWYAAVVWFEVVIRKADTVGSDIKRAIKTVLEPV